MQYIILLRGNRNYRYLWLGNVVSLLGDWFNLIASASLIAALTDSGVAISYLFLARFLPLFLFSPLAGVLADRYSRRGLMILSDLLRAATVFGFLLIRTADQVWLLYTLTITQFVLSALFTPARNAIIANVVPKEDLITANALDSFTWSTMLAFGSFLGGVAAALFGVKTAFALDALTFLLSAWLISRVVIEGSKTAVSIPKTGWFDFVDGFRYLWGQPFILIVGLVKGGGSLVWGAINVLEIVFAERVYPLGEFAFGGWFTIQDGSTATLGMIYVVSGFGTGLGPLLMRRWLGDKPPRLMRGITIGFFLMAGGIWCLGAANTFPLFLLATFIRTIGTGTLWVFSSALLQMIVPDRYRGRVFAFEFAVLTLTQSISILLAGIMQDKFNMPVREVASMAGLFGIGVALGWAIFQFNSSRHLEEYVVSVD